MYEVQFIEVKSKENKFDSKTPPNDGKNFESHFYEEIKPFLNLAKIVGALPITKNKTGKLKFKILSWITIYSFLLLSIIAIYSGFLIQTQIHALQTNEINFDDKVVLYGALLSLGFYVLPVISFFESNKIAKYFTSWLNFEQKYFKITKNRLNYKIRHLQKITLFIMILDSLFVLYFLYYVIYVQQEKYMTEVSITTRVLFIITYFYYLWIIHTFVGTWIFITLGIRKTAKTLLDDLQDTKLKSYCFDELYALWIDLKNLTEDLGTAYSWSYIYFLTYMFVMVMATFYSLFVSLATPGSETNSVYLVCALMSSCFFGLIADSAHRTSQQVGDEYKSVLQQLLLNEKDPVLKRDMKWFIQTLSFNSPVITLSGYFTLNREFNVSMLGTLVTYIVVVLQFRATSAGKTASHNISN